MEAGRGLAGGALFPCAHWHARALHRPGRRQPGAPSSSTPCPAHCTLPASHTRGWNLHASARACFGCSVLAHYHDPHDHQRGHQHQQQLHHHPRHHHYCCSHHQPMIHVGRKVSRKGGMGGEGGGALLQLPPPSSPSSPSSQAPPPSSQAPPTQPPATSTEGGK
eukprot:990759-Rhodomonas_salina.2